MKRVLFVTLCFFMCVSVAGCSCGMTSDELYEQAGHGEISESVDVYEWPERICVLDDEGGVVFENDSCALYVTDVGLIEGTDDYAIDVICINTGEEDLLFSLGEFAINGWMIDKYWEGIVESGERLSESIPLSNHYPFIDITTADRISFLADVCVYGEMCDEMLVREYCTVYTSEMTDEEIIIPQRKSSENEIVLLDDERFSLIVLEIEADYEPEPEIWCYLENKTGAYVEFTITNVSVNGWAMEWSSFEQLLPNSRNYTYLCFADCATAERCKIEQYDKVVFDLSISSIYNNENKEYLSERLCMYPTGLSDEEIVVPEHKGGNGEQLLLDNEVGTLIVEPLRTEGDTVIFSVYFHNRSERVLCVSMDEVDMNGRRFENWAGEMVVYPGEYSYVTVSHPRNLIVGGSLENMEEEEIESMDCLLRVYDIDNCEADDIFNEHIEGRFV